MPITLVVEDGSGDPDANAYISIAFINTYHTDRGNTYWALLDSEVKKTCVIKATDYIDKRFGEQFRGFRMQKDQALRWPRLAAFDDDKYSLDGVPKNLMKATAEYALRAAIYNVLAPDPLRPVPTQDMSVEDPNVAATEDVVVGSLKSKIVKVGPIEKRVVYEGIVAIAQANASGSRSVQSNVINDIFIPQYPEADMLIEPLLDSSFVTSLVRA